MNPVTLAGILGELGIAGFDPTKMSAIMGLLGELGGSVQVDKDELGAYYPEIGDTGWYIPKAPKGFYDGCFETLREASKPDYAYLRKFTTPRLHRR